MSNPIEKIGRGLDAHERAKADGSFRMSNLVGAPVSVSDLNKVAEHSTRLRDRLKLLASGVSKAVETHRAETEKRYSEVGKEQDENGVVRDTLGPDRRRRMIEGEVARFRKEALQASAEERGHLMAELRANNEKIAAVADMWSDPVAVLMRSTRADSKRSTYAANLSSSGPIEVVNALRDAVLTGDKALAAAALSRLDAMPKDSRKLVRLSKRDVAEPLVSDEWNKARTFIAITEIAVTEAEIADNEAEGKTILPQRKIGLGLKKRELETVLGISDDDHSQAGETLEEQLDRKYPGVPGSGRDAIGGEDRVD